MQRARKIERFLSQPFHVAEQFTGTAGQYVPIAETVRSFKEILEGKHDDLPEARVPAQGLDRRRRRGRQEEPSSVAPRAKFTVEVLTPEGEVFNDEVEMVSTRTSVGSIGILANHQPLLGMLEPTELRLYKSETDIVRFAQGEGYVQVSADGVLLLVEEAVEPGELDTAELQEKLQRAEQELRAAEEGSEAAARRRARQAPRAEAFLRIAGSGDSRRPLPEYAARRERDPFHRWPTRSAASAAWSRPRSPPWPS